MNTDTPTEPTRLRRATQADATAVADVLIRSRKAADGLIPPSVHPDDDVRTWVATVVIPGREVWVAVTADDQIVAVLVLRDDWVDQLYVDAGWTGNGLGGQLLAHAKQQRPDGLQLWTFVSNTRARLFYERHGFSVAQATDGADNEENQPDLRLVWPAEVHTGANRVDLL